MIEHDTLSDSEFHSLLKQVGKTLPGAVGRTDVSLERKREIVVELFSRVRDSGLALCRDKECLVPGGETKFAFRERV